jgi:hypothetical protein
VVRSEVAPAEVGGDSPRRLVRAFGSSSTGVERMYALADATVIIGNIACDFSECLREAGALASEGGSSWKT